jgi:hypothetical protein
LEDILVSWLFWKMSGREFAFYYGIQNRRLFPMQDGVIEPAIEPVPQRKDWLFIEKK